MLNLLTGFYQTCTDKRGQGAKPACEDGQLLLSRLTGSSLAAHCPLPSGCQLLH